MDAKLFQESLSMQDVYSLLDHLGADPQETNRGTLNCRTICHNHHGGGKHNLRYFGEGSFQCFSECGHMSVYDFVGKVLDLDFYESFKYVLSFFNQSMYDMDMKQESYEDVVDLGFFDRVQTKEIQTLNEVDNKVLNIYYDLYYQGWIEEGITIETMEKYKIKNSIVDRQIIIPHYDEFDRLVGVRCRNLDKDLVSQGKKYMPVINNGEMLNHSTGSVLYGLNFNRENIERVQKVILFESEKAVMQLDSFMPNMSIGVCLSGSNLTNRQVEILKGLDINEVCVGFDKEYENIGDNEEKFYAKKIEETVMNKLKNHYHISVLWDTQKLLNRKDAPTDKGKETFEKMWKNRIFL